MIAAGGSGQPGGCGGACGRRKEQLPVAQAGLNSPRGSPGQGPDRAVPRWPPAVAGGVGACSGPA